MEKNQNIYLNIKVFTELSSKRMLIAKGKRQQRRMNKIKATRETPMLKICSNIFDDFTGSIFIYSFKTCSKLWEFKSKVDTLNYKNSDANNQKTNQYIHRRIQCDRALKIIVYNIHIINVNTMRNKIKFKGVGIENIHIKNREKKKYNVNTSTSSMQNL